MSQGHKERGAQRREGGLCGYNCGIRSRGQVIGAVSVSTLSGRACRQYSGEGHVALFFRQARERITREEGRQWKGTRDQGARKASEVTISAAENGEAGT